LSANFDWNTFFTRFGLACSPSSHRNFGKDLELLHTNFSKLKIPFLAFGETDSSNTVIPAQFTKPASLPSGSSFIPSITTFHEMTRPMDQSEGVYPHTKSFITEISQKRKPT